MPALPPNIRDEDYEAIEMAVMESARGRWFLNEYARRNRTADTTTVLDAVARLEQVVTATEPHIVPDDNLKTCVSEMNTAVMRLHRDLALLHKTKAGSNDISSIAGVTEQATQQILSSAEDVQEAAWSLRELGGHPDFCEKLDRYATEIYIACSFQDLTGQRITKIVQTMAYLEERITALGKAVGMTAAVEPPALSDVPLEQNAVDEVFESDTSSVIIDDVLVMQPAHYAAQAASMTLIEAQSIAVPQMKPLSQQPPQAVAPPANFNLSSYSFEEKLALFS